MRNVIEVRAEWLIEAAPHFYKTSELNLGTKMAKNMGKPSDVPSTIKN